MNDRDGGAPHPPVGGAVAAAAAAGLALLPLLDLQLNVPRSVLAVLTRPYGGVTLQQRDIVDAVGRVLRLRLRAQWEQEQGGAGGSVRFRAHAAVLDPLRCTEQIQGNQLRVLAADLVHALAPSTVTLTASVGLIRAAAAPLLPLSLWRQWHERDYADVDAATPCIRLSLQSEDDCEPLGLPAEQLQCHSTDNAIVSATPVVRLEHTIRQQHKHALVVRRAATAGQPAPTAPPEMYSGELPMQLADLLLCHRLHRYLCFHVGRVDADAVPLLEPPALDAHQFAFALELVEEKLVGLHALVADMRIRSRRFMQPMGGVHRGILLHGPPGTGKTTIMRELLPLAGFTLVTQPLAAADFLKGIVGDSERMANELGARARRLPWEVCVLPIDEIEVMAQSRSGMNGGGSSSGGSGNQQMASLLTLVLALVQGIKDVPNLLLVGATNLRETLDEALLRRMTLQLHIGVLNTAGRNEWLQRNQHRLRFESDGSRKQLPALFLQWTLNFTNDAMSKLFDSLAMGPPVNSSRLFEAVKTVCVDERIRIGSHVVAELLAGQHAGLASLAGATAGPVSSITALRLRQVIAPAAGRECSGRVLVDLSGSDPASGIQLERIPFVDVEANLLQFLRALLRDDPRISWHEDFQRLLPELGWLTTAEAAQWAALPEQALLCLRAIMAQQVMDPQLRAGQQLTRDQLQRAVKELLRTGLQLPELRQNDLARHLREADQLAAAAAQYPGAAGAAAEPESLTTGLYSLVRHWFLVYLVDQIATLAAGGALLNPLADEAESARVYLEIGELRMEQLRARAAAHARHVQLQTQLLEDASTLALCPCTPARAQAAGQGSASDSSGPSGPVSLSGVRGLLSSLLELAIGGWLPSPADAPASSPGCDWLLLLDIHHMLGRHLVREDDMVLHAVAMFAEAARYNRVMIIIDMDSLAEVTRSDAQSQPQRQAGKESASIGTPPSFRLLRENLFMTLCRLMQSFQQGEGPQRWCFALARHPELIVRFKDATQWPPLPADEQKKKEREAASAPRPCEYCLTVYRPLSADTVAGGSGEGAVSDCPRHRSGRVYRRTRAMDDGKVAPPGPDDGRFAVDAVGALVSADKLWAPTLHYECCDSKWTGVKDGCLPMRHSSPGDSYGRAFNQVLRQRMGVCEWMPPRVKIDEPLQRHLAEVTQPIA